MQRLFVIALLLLLTPDVSASSPQRGRSGSGYDRKEVIYGRKYGIALTMDVFTPQTVANGAGVIVVMSGGWNSDHSAITPTLPNLILPLLEKGYTTFAVVHGSNPKFSLPEMIEDLHRAVRFIRHGAREFRIDPERLGITGASAGGHLALMQGCAGKEGNPKTADSVEGESSRVQAVVAFYPPTDFLNWGDKGKVMLGQHPIVPVKGAFDFYELNPKTVSFDLIIDENKRLQIGKDISPISHVAKDNPPTLLIHGDKDVIVPLQQSVTMAARLKDAGVISELIIGKDRIHNALIVHEQRPKMLEWFDRYLTKRK
jgi:acetyl esterase/lipase